MSGDFWSRRREAVAAEAVADAQAVEQAEADKVEAELDARTDEDILTELNLADPDALETPEAVKDFLSHGLPQRLKTRALRRLWRLNPILANVDGLVDYGEDYTDAATVIEGMQTAYQVGKGMLAHVEAMSKEAEAESDPDHADEPAVEDAVAEENDAETPVVLAEVGLEAVPVLEPMAHDAETLDDTQAPPSLNRRMTFQFESVT